MPQRLRSEGIVLAPALLAIALLVFWSAHGGGYEPTTWEPSALLVLGLLVATAAGLGGARLRLSRPAGIALAALGGYVAWSYLSILWAASPADALDGSNRTLLYALLLGLFALLPWRTWTALVALSAFGLALGALAVVTLIRIGASAHVAGLFHDGRLTAPAGYENGSAALFTVGALVSVALAARRELPVLLRAPLLAGATASLQAAVLCESRGWLFSLPIVLVLALAVLPGRVRLLLWTLPAAAGALLALPALLDVYDRVDAVPWDKPTAGVLADAAAHASAVALPLCAGVLLAALALAVADRRVTVSPRVAQGANRAAAALAIAAALAGVVAGLVATHGRPDRKIAHYWERSQGYRQTPAGSSRFGLVGSNRPDFWRVSLDATAAHPLAGLGQDNWGDYYLRHRHSHEQPRWAHSLELRLLAHTGIVGFLLFAAFMVAGVLATLRERSRAARLTRAAAATALLPLAVWTVHGSVDWFWEIPALSGPAFAFLGMGMALGRDEALPAARRRSPAVGRLAWGAAGILALLAALAIALPYLARRDLADATAHWRTDPSAALGRLGRAAALNPLSGQPDATAAVISLELARPGRARRRFTIAINREPANWFYAFGRGLAASAIHDRAAARADFRRAGVLNPGEPLVREALARIDTRKPLTAQQAFARLERGVRKLTGGQ